jgi:hypothetical protein
MTKIFSSFSIVAIVLGVVLHAGFAQAQSDRTWVSHSGDDANTCAAASPCLTFAGAYAKTSAGGEIDVLDGGDFGPLQISHALTVANDGAGTAAITPAGAAAIVVTAGPTDAVVLRGLTLHALNSPVAGVLFDTGASVRIDHCTIEGFQGVGGIVFVPSSNAASLWVADTVLSNDGPSTGGGVSMGAGVLIAPQNGGAATAQFERVRILHAIGNGIRIDGTFSGAGATDVELHEVTVDGASASGIVAVSSGGPTVNVMADNVTSSHNNGFGVRAVGGTASLKLRRSTVTNNVRGIGASSGGALVSYSDNSIADNTNGDGDPTATLPLK